MSIRDELLTIKAASPDDKLHIGRVIAWARRHTRSALHRELEWNNRIAGEAWRRQQVRVLVAVHVREEGQRTLISLSVDRKTGGGYRDLREVARAPLLAQIAEADALNELIRVRNRYQHIRRFMHIWRSISMEEGKKRKRIVHAGKEERASV